MRHKKELIRRSGAAYVGVAIGMALLPREADGGHILPPAYHLVEDGTRKAQGTLTTTGTAPNLAASEFLLFVAKAPHCATQSEVTSELSVTVPSTSTVDEVSEGSGGTGRRLLRALPCNNSGQAEHVYSDSYLQSNVTRAAPSTGTAFDTHRALVRH